MAGSYHHLFKGWSMIEHMGDAYECVEELWWLVERAVGRKEALRLLEMEFYPMARGEKALDSAMKTVERGMGK